MIKKYIELNTSIWLPEDYTDEIRFISKKEFNYNLIEIIEEFYINIVTGTEKEFNKKLEKIMLNNNDLITDYELSEEDKKYILDLKEDFNNYITNDVLEELCNELSVYINTAGYSDWCYYIAPDSTYRSFANDLWDGYNFYDIAILDEKGRMMDSVSCCYITNEDELIHLVNDYFSIDEKDILLVKNAESQYFDFKKVKKQVKEYEFFEC